jgi:serine/threonine protein kinase
VLGRGGQGTVYLAYDPNFDLEVALKVLDEKHESEQLIERFLSEARLLVRLTHPNIVRVFELNPSYPYIVLEYCDGEDLNYKIKARSPMKWREILEISEAVANALVVTHGNTPQILHRDLKPGNVLFTGSTPKVADFGLAKQVGKGMTTTRGMMGTIGYSSPEQLKNAADVDARTDLWALGVMLYEMVTFRRPFEMPGDDFVNTALRVRTEPMIEPPFTIPDSVRTIIDRCLQKEPDKRYESAVDVVTALKDARSDLSSLLDTPVPPEEVLEEMDRLAQETAKAANTGSMEVGSCVKKMFSINPDHSLTAYWGRLSRAMSSSSQSSSSRGGSSQSEGTAAPVTSLAEADRLASQYNFEDAIRALGKLVGENPGDESLQGRLSAVAARKKELETSLNSCEKRSTAASSQQRFEDAISVWSEFLERFPGHAVAEGRLQELRKKAGQQAEKQEQKARQEADRRREEARASAAAMETLRQQNLSELEPIVAELDSLGEGDPSLQRAVERIRAASGSTYDTAAGERSLADAALRLESVRHRSGAARYDLLRAIGDAWKSTGPDSAWLSALASGADAQTVGARRAELEFARSSADEQRQSGNKKIAESLRQAIPTARAAGVDVTAFQEEIQSIEKGELALSKAPHSLGKVLLVAARERAGAEADSRAALRGTVETLDPLLTTPAALQQAAKANTAKAWGDLAQATGKARKDLDKRWTTAVDGWKKLADPPTELARLADETSAISSESGGSRALRQRCEAMEHWTRAAVAVQMEKEIPADFRVTDKSRRIWGRAFADGDSQTLNKLLREKRPAGKSVRERTVSKAALDWNRKLQPGRVKAWESAKDPAERARLAAGLVEPRAIWKNPVLWAAAALVVVALGLGAWGFRPTTQTWSLSVALAEGAPAITSWSRDGSPWSAPPGNWKPGSSVTLALPPGSYSVDLESGSSISWEVPGRTHVLIPAVVKSEDLLGSYFGLEDGGVTE